MSDHYKMQALELIKNYQNSPYMVGGGTVNGRDIIATKSLKEITFSHNLGPHYVPTQQEAIELLNGLKERFEDYCAACPQFVAYVGKRQFIAELMVFSGHMDFKVATLIAGEYEWYSNLKNKDTD